MKRKYFYRIRSFVLPAFLFFFFCILFFFSGCAVLQEAGRKVWGTSVVHLQRQRETAETDVFSLSLEDALRRCAEIIEESGAAVTLKDEDRQVLVAMQFKGYVDTTQVGIFFTPLENGETRLEVASMVPSLAREVAELIFSGLRSAHGFKAVEKDGGM